MSTVTDAPSQEEIDAAEERARQIEQNMKAAGVQTEVAVQHDYFDFDVTHQEFLPDGISYVEHKELNEGQRSRYLKETNRDVRLQKMTGDAIVRMSPGDERKALLKAAIVGWNFVSAGKPVKFDDRNLDKWLTVANPRHVDIVEKAVRKANPWLLNDASIEDLEKEAADLQELIETKSKEEAGKAT